ncbi:MAG: diacylglycerol kinase family protein [Patescibacteria group bacterium]
MTTISFPRFARSTRHAMHGLAHAFTTENNFRIHTVIALAVAGLAVVLRISRSDAAMIILVIASMLILELVNTIVERFADLLEPRVHPYVHIIKDIMAATVVIAALAAIGVGGLVFWPYLADWFRPG